MKQLLILKMGGSVITKKNQISPTIDFKNIKKLADQISQIYKSKKYNIILVHGAGSFAHPLVKKTKIDQGVKTFNQQIALAKTCAQMITLNHEIISSLIAVNVPAVGFSPHTFLQQKDKKIAKFHLEELEKFLQQGYVPVLYGDMVLDVKLNASVVSGDGLVAYLAKSLKAKKVMFLTDVDGIFDKNPKLNKDAKLIKQINDKNFTEIFNNLTIYNNNDVTGEIRGKLETIKNELKNIEVEILNGNNFLFKKKKTKTRILFV